MGHIKDIKSNLDPQTFPGATFEIQGEVPETQCSEAAVEGDHGETGASGFILLDPGNFVGWNLTDKVLHITSPPANIGDYDITDNSDDHLALAQSTPAASFDNVYFVTNGGELILTRNVQSFAQFIHAAGHSYTIKGNKLYTNIPSDQLQNACSILFDPLT